MTEKFSGFSPDAFQFLRNLPNNNHKEWFELHKADYHDHVLKPLQALVAGLGPLMMSIDPDFEVTPAISKTISRIYRDTRFSKDKSPYKTSHWITFKRPGSQWQDYPAYFFEISPYSYCYGMGFYHASRETMDRFRHGLDVNPAKFVSVTESFSKNGLFTIEGEVYKRPLKTDISAELQDWYNRKNFYLVSNNPIEGNSIVKGLISELIRGFTAMAPFYGYLCGVAAYGQ
jgi:uncharacterized protein (TIGR02453 family)